MIVTRTLVAAVTAATLAAPSALARPVDTPIYSAQPSVTHDLRSPESPGAARLPHGTERDPRQLRVGNAVPDTQPISAPLTPAAQHDDGIDLATIGLGIAGGLVGVGAITGMAAHSRRPQRRRATA